MSAENRCPTCGAMLPKAGATCAFCLEAQRLLQHLAQEDEVRLCTRCGAILEEGEEKTCARCRQVPVAPLTSFWRREDRIAAWIRDHVVEPEAEREGIVCPDCGAPNAPLAAFCSRCGRRLAGAELPPQVLGDSRPEDTFATDTPGEEERAARQEDAGMSGEEERPARQEAAGAESFQQTIRAWWQEWTVFIQEQFRSSGPAVESRPQRPWWQRLTGHSEKSRPVGESSWNANTVLWIVLGVLLTGLVFLAIFWAQLLRAGGIVFH